MLRSFALIALLVSPTLVHALTMEFVGIPREWHPDFPDVYEEDGIFFDGYGDLQTGYYSDGSVYLNYSASSLAGAARVTTGGLFRADSMAFKGHSLPIEHVILDPDTGAEFTVITDYKAMQIEGYLKGNLIAETVIDMNEHSTTEGPSPLGYPYYYFGDEFSAVDALVITILTPAHQYRNTSFMADLHAQYPDFEVYSNGCGDTEYCSSAVLDNITLTPVPLPAGVWLFGSALGLLGYLRRRRAIKARA